ncbi:heme NO-binding domain-containing protein [Prosthecobacter sp.]|uniref:heme NO-binding domain-containing protein n=1 Tax=Prosthecobacter sp. TaxID=1965333 RepID=UPI0024899B21|nr:heme NO-binding domain-containing protein [Prosthecobacter sp.]MDI1313275.1 heme NO-binding domain-containing protein [Prosthecobacter sp.]
MYGLVNKALQDLLVANHGEDTWQRVKSKVGVEDELFISTEPDLDETICMFVAAAAEVLNRPGGEILNLFNCWWILNTARHGYSQLLKAGGHSLGEVLQNQPNFHTRIKMMFPALHPFKFEWTDVESAELRLHYRSHRRRLSAFVIGLMEDLGEMFAVVVRIMHEQQVDQGADNDVFHIAWSEGGAL